MVAEMGLIFNALPQGFVLSDTLLEVAVEKTVRFVDVYWFVSHYTTDRAARRGVGVHDWNVTAERVVVCTYWLATTTELMKENQQWECYG
jgi:hypothetical protein